MATKNTNWSEQEQMMASAYVNIANSLPYIQQMMKQHVKSAQNGGGIINDGDLQEILDELANMINKNLRNVSQSRVSFKLTPISSTSTQPQVQNVTESFQRKNKILLSESQLHKVIKDSVRKILNEAQLNGLDPRAYANYARGREEQANGLRPLSQAQHRKGTSKYDLQHKAQLGRNAAADAWNNQYGRKESHVGGPKSSYAYRYMRNGDYNVHDSFNELNRNDYGRFNCQRDYNPYDNTSHYEANGYDNYGNKDFEIRTDAQGTANKGERVAREMAQGNSNYVKGQGWQ